MALTDMKRPKPKRSREVNMTSPDVSYEKYGYGLRINLDSIDIKKLGDQLDNLRLGGMVTIVAKAEVVGMDVGGNIYDGKKEENQSVSLQIQRLSVSPVAGVGDNSLKSVKRRIQSLSD